MIKLRPYQLEINQSVKNAWETVDNVLLVLPTGGGKTICMSELIHHVNGPVCAIAHRQELVSQISLALARNGIHHKIIGPPNVIKLIVRVHMMVLGKSYYNSQAPVAVAGVDTLIRRHDQLARWLPTVKLWVIDECFPAGTLVDGKPIETLKVGDYVTAFDESSDKFSKQKITRLFKNPQPKLMIKLVTVDSFTCHSVTSTLGHPFWTKRGWVDAVNLSMNDEILIYYGQNKSHWVYLESIQVYPSSSTGFVYNIEVDKYHTYTANGIVVHNCHHLLKENKWGTAVDMFPNAKGLGVTATPMRADGKGLGRHASGVMDKMIVGPTGRELINSAPPYLTDYRIFAPVSNLDMSKARISKATGDFNQHDAAHAVQESSLITHGQSTRVGDVVNHYLKITPGKLGITFVPDMETGRQIEEQFNFAGVPAKLVNAKTPDDIRARTIQDFSRGEYKQLLNVDLFGEGFDLPALEVVSMARPTDSYGLFVQMFGRVLRLMEGKEVGTIIDHVGNVIKFAQRYGLPDAYNDWTLDDRTKGERESNNGIPMKACPECTFMYERFKKACPDCGHIPVPISRSEIKYVEGSLQELDPFILSKLRGEVLSFDEPMEKQIQLYQAGQQAKKIPYIWEKANTKRFANKLKESQSMQVVLRDAMAWWAGYRRHEGLSDDEIHRLFYLKFDVDWLSAMTLPATDANVLINRIGEQI